MIVFAIKFDIDVMHMFVFDITKELESEFHGCPVNLSANKTTPVVAVQIL